ncbi:hypothetical protein Tsubulata_031125 [Turnera subulata]|uniref:PHD-type domain-containing protein n=1 Tax=Turnera subulata TaxID=218843 RepID=A0A9Q0JFS6_9ROSI|nr:hypothetical protein Tsubulata_031125 [Turnera subulata]
MPRLISFGVWDLCYGLSVDVYHDGDWREGVIMDHEDGSVERAVFLPDSCTKIKTRIKFLKIGQEQDQVTGVWRLRGTRPLPESIEKSSLGLPVKEVSCKSKESVGSLKSEFDKEPMSRVSEETECEKDSRIKDLSAVYINSPGVLENQDPDNCVMEIDQDEGNGCVTSLEGTQSPVNEGDSKGNNQSKRGRKPSNDSGSGWLPVTPGMIPVAEFCPHAITKYINLPNKKGRTAKDSLAMDVRKHISFLGWKIEYRMQTFHNKYEARVYRYKSPDNKTYQSLVKLCEDPSILNSVNSVDGSPVVSSVDTKESSARKRKREALSEVVDSNGSKDDDSIISASDDESNPLPPVDDDDDDGGDDDDDDYDARPEQPRRGKVMADLKRQEGARKRKHNPKNSKRTVLSRRTILSVLIDNNVVSSGAKVHYSASKSKGSLTTGRITPDGIECDCCKIIHSLTAFEAHAGSTQHRPAANIILDEDGRTLSQCQEEIQIEDTPKARRKKGKTPNGSGCRNPKRSCRKRKPGENDTICSVCRDGGDLILCDRCPSSFHKDCLRLETVPDGEWFCPPCRCSSCDQGRLKESSSGQPLDMLRCTQCRRRYHSECLGNIGEEATPKEGDTWFCSSKCRDIFSGLQELVGKPIVVGPDNLTWTLLRPTKFRSDSNRKLRHALRLMHECFEPVEDFYTGTDLVESVIYSRGCDLDRLNFEGFYTILLERNSKALSAATLRVLGEELAELPLVCTSYRCRRMGLCGRLMNQLEEQLVRLGVQKLLLPAAQNVLSTWENAFGFSRVSDTEKPEYLKHTLLDFQGTVLCHKRLTKTS